MTTSMLARAHPPDSVTTKKPRKFSANAAARYTCKNHFRLYDTGVRVQRENYTKTPRRDQLVQREPDD